MKNRLVLSVLLIALAASAGWSQFYNAYTSAERMSLSEAYWLAGQAYVKAGKTAKGQEFMRMARNIYPELDTALIKDEALPSAAELLAQGPTMMLAAPPERQAATRNLDSFFLRFVGSLVSENATRTVGFLDGSVYLTKLSSEMTRDQAQTELQALFDAVPLSEMAPSAVYNLETIKVAAAAGSLSQLWGPTWVLTVDAKEDFSSYLPFWEQKQELYIRQVASDYYIAAIGQESPPPSWKPASLPSAPVEVAALPQSPGEVSQAIIDAFTGCVSSFLKKNADAAATFLAPEVKLLRLQQTATRDDLKASFLGAFESEEFGKTTFEDLYDTASIFVQRTTDFASEVTGTEYLLTAMAKVDLADKIPFWGTWQGFYFVQEEGNWRIFAIR